jgi:hypothetical protein
MIEEARFFGGSADKERFGPSGFYDIHKYIIFVL